MEVPWCQVLIEVQTDEKSYEEVMFYCSVEIKVEWASPSLRHGMLKVQPQTVVSHFCIPREAEVSPEGRASFPRKNVQDTKGKVVFGSTDFSPLTPQVLEWVMQTGCNFMPVRAVETRVLHAAFCVKFPVELCKLFTALCCVEGNPWIHKDKCFMSL